MRSEACRGPRFDVLGAWLLGLGLAGVTAGLTFGNELGWSSPFVVAALFVGLAGLALFVPVERRHPHPLLQFAIFRDRTFASASVALVLSFLGLFATSFPMPFYLEQLRGFSTEQAGLTLTALPATLALVSPLSGTLSDRIGSRVPCVTGMSLASLGLVLLSRLNATTPLLEIVLPLVIIGAGQALFQPANDSALMGSAPRERQGVDSGILATARVVGQSLSVAVTGAIFMVFGAANAAAEVSTSSASAVQAESSLAGFRAATFTRAGIAVLRGRVRPSEPKRRRAAATHAVTILTRAPRVDVSAREGPR